MLFMGQPEDWGSSAESGTTEHEHVPDLPPLDRILSGVRRGRRLSPRTNAAGALMYPAKDAKKIGVNLLDLGRPEVLQVVQGKKEFLMARRLTGTKS